MFKVGEKSKSVPERTRTVPELRVTPRRFYEQGSRLAEGYLLDDEENLRFGPEEDHVDILASIGEMPFEQVWRNRIEAEVGGVTVPFISKADLIENKRQVGRLRDLADAEELELILDEGGA